MTEPTEPFSAYLPSGMERFDQQMHFIAEIDKMTQVLRQTLLLDKSRRENDAEHSWHLAVMALVLGEYCVEPPNIDRAIKMVVVHDLIEVYAGDTFAYDSTGAQSTKAARESAAADKLFALLPQEQALQIRALWEEFDARSTADSCFAASLDCLQPFFHNTLTDGATWVQHHVAKSAVLARMQIIHTTMPRLWTWVQANLQRAVERGWLRDE